MRRIGRVWLVALVGVVLVTGAGVALADDSLGQTGTIVVTFRNERGNFSGLYDDGAGTREFTDRLGAPPGGGDGALVLGTPRNQDKVMFLTRDLGPSLTRFFDATYWIRSGPPPEQPPTFQPRPAPYARPAPEPAPGGNPAPDGNRGPGGDRGPGDQGTGGSEPGPAPGPEETPQPVPSFQIAFDPTGGRIEPREVFVLTYYPESTPGDDWQQENLGAGRFCLTVQISRRDAHRLACPVSERRTIQDVAGQYPQAGVLFAGVNQGGGNGNTTTAVDLIQAGDLTYDFEPE